MHQIFGYKNSKKKVHSEDDLTVNFKSPLNVLFRASQILVGIWTRYFKWQTKRKQAVTISCHIFNNPFFFINCYLWKAPDLRTVRLKISVCNSVKFSVFLIMLINHSNCFQSSIAWPRYLELRVILCYCVLECCR